MCTHWCNNGASFIGSVLSGLILVKSDYMLCCIISMLALYVQPSNVTLNKYDVMCLSYGNVLNLKQEIALSTEIGYYVPRFCCVSWLREGCLFRTCSTLSRGRRYCFCLLIHVSTRVYTSLKPSVLRAAAGIYVAWSAHSQTLNLLCWQWLVPISLIALQRSLWL